MSIEQRINIVGLLNIVDQSRLTQPFPTTITEPGSQQGYTLVFTNYSNIDIIIQFPVEGWVATLPRRTHGLSHIIVSGETSFSYASDILQPQALDNILVVNYYAPQESKPNVQLITLLTVPHSFPGTVDTASIAVGSSQVVNFVAFDSITYPPSTTMVAYINYMYIYPTSATAWSKWRIGWIGDVSGIMDAVFHFVIGSTTNPYPIVVTTPIISTLFQGGTANNEIDIYAQLDASAGGANASIIVTSEAYVVPQL